MIRMPFVSITLAEGRNPEVLRALIHEVTLAVERSGAAPRENVRVVLHEVPPTHFAAGDVTLAERAAVSAPVADGSASDPAGPAAAADDASRPDGIHDRAVEATTHEQEPRA